jgi:hypothetical protein
VEKSIENEPFDAFNQLIAGKIEGITGFGFGG